MVRTKKITVLMGGKSSERNISLLSGEACAVALEELGFTVSKLDVSDGQFINILQETNPDVVFNALHGSFGEDGKIQAILEYLNLPYTHSGVLASALAMDKPKAKVIAEQAGVKVANSVVVNRKNISKDCLIPAPYVIKPVSEGSSFGVVIVKEGEEFPVDLLNSEKWQFGDMLLLEKYVPGRELSCAVLDDKALDVCETFINEQYKFYDLNAKYQKGGSTHECPANISPNIYKLVQTMSLAAHRALGCRGVSRSDFRFDEKSGELVWLEVNTQPGMTEVSLLPDIAKVSGISFNEMVGWIVEDASCKR